MARSFAITTTAADALKADARGHAEVVFTITNVTARPVRGMARAQALDATKQEWLTIAGETDRDFAAGATQQFTVNFDAAGATRPTAGGGAPAPKYTFRLNVASAMNPDEDFAEGPTVTVQIEPTPVQAMPSAAPRMWWIIPVAAVVLIGIAIVAWLLLRTKKVEVPNVVGKPVAEATSILSDAKLKANVGETRVTGTVPEGRVAEQSPETGGGRVPEGSTVELVVEARPVSTPSPTQRINVALDKNAKQSSTMLNALASRAVDGNTSGNWALNSVTHTERTPNPWWQVDLGTEQSIVQIKIWNRTDCCPERLSNFYVLVSTAPFTSNDLNSTINQAGVSAFQAPAQAGTPTTITVGKPGRFVRVQLVGTDYLSLAEVEVIADVTPNAAWSSDGDKQQIVGGGFGFGDVQYVQRSYALLSIVRKQNSWVVLRKPKRAGSILS